MEEIQADEYARTKHDGIIRIREIKQEKVFETYYEMGQSYSHSEDKIFIYYKDDDRRIPIDDIVKHSHDIIDLIEVGDYVNGHKVTAVYLDGQTKYLKLDNAYENGEGIRTYAEDIKTIVTREQFTQIEYKLEE